MLGRAVFAVLLALVLQAAPRAGSLSAVAPLGASPGVTVQVTGLGFATTASDNDVYFTPAGGAAVKVTGAAIATLNATTGLRRLAVVLPNLPVGAAAVRVVNRVNGDSAEGRSIQVIHLTREGAGAAVRGTAGLAVRITGTPNTAFVAGRTRAVFGAGITVLSTVVESATSLVATIDVSATAALGPRDITVIASTQTGLITAGFAVENPPPPNAPPSVDAGQDLSITQPATTVAIDATVTDDGLPSVPGALTYAWSRDSGPGEVSFAPPDAADTTATLTAAGTYVLRLTASDGAESRFDLVTVTVNEPPNQAPGVDAGPDRTITLPANAQLDATVTDDGRPIPPGALTYAWSQTSGPGTVTFGSGSAEDTTASFSEAGSYVLRLVVGDGALSAFDEVSVLVNPPTPPANQPPTVSAGTSQAITLPAHATLDGTASDDGLPKPPATLTYAWSKVSGPGPVVFASPGAVDTTASFTAPGEYVVRLTVSDGAASVSADVGVTVHAPPNGAPTANAGDDQSVTLPVNQVSLTGTVGDDGLPAGSTLATTWSLVSGPAPVAFGNAASAGTTATFNAVGTYLLKLLASDGDRSASDEVTITVLPEPVIVPVNAHAGGPYSGQVGQALTFDGRASRDSANEALTYAWEFGDGATATGPTPSHIYGGANGGSPFVVRLTVRTPSGRSAEATTSATIAEPPPSPVTPPIANAGGPYSGLSGQTITLDGSQSSNAAGGPLTYEWAFGDGTTGTGPAPRHIYATASSIDGFLVTLTVRNTGGASHTTTTRAVIAAPPATNAAPVSRPGGPYATQTGVPLTFDGTASSDPDAQPIVLAWTFGDGASGSGPTPSHTYSEPGTYLVALTVTDSATAQNTATTTVTVTAAAVTNRTPVARPGGPYAGNAAAALAFDGRASSDGDGDALTYAWEFGDGSSGAGPTPTHTYATPGVYTVALTVADGRGGSDRRTVNASIGDPLDRVSPVVVLSAPSSTLPGTPFTVEALAKDNVGVTSVSFVVTGAGTAAGPVDDPTAPYEVSVAAAPTAAAGATIVVRGTARDAAGNTALATATILIVAAPDTTAPTVTLSAPAEAAPGSSIVLTAAAGDNVGVKQVHLTTGGSPIATLLASPYQSSYVIPEGAAPGSSLSFTATARDFAGNVGEAEATVAIVAAPPASPPTITVTAPDEVTVGGSLHMTASADDVRGIASVTFFVDDVPVAIDTIAPYDATFVAPPGRGAGAVLHVRARALNLASLSADALADVRVVAARAVPAGVVGRVYDDGTSLPLAGAAVRLRGQDALGVPYDATAVTDDRGRYFLPTNGGEAFVEIERAGWTRVDRAVVFGTGSTLTAFDARLTRLASAGTAVPALLGGTVSGPDLTLHVPAGALASDRALAVTRVGQQGLAGLLPAGWTPVAVADVTPHDTEFGLAATLTVAPLVAVPPSAAYVLALWDETAHAWRAAGQTAAAENGRVGASITRGGQYAWLLGDSVPAAPPVPALGDVLSGVAASTVPDTAAIVITPSPRIAVYQPGFRADVGAQLTTAAPLSSATPLVVRHSEAYLFTDESALTVEPFVEGLVFYQRPGAPTELRASWPVMPSVPFEAGVLDSGVIAVDVFTPDDEPGAGSTLVGPDGGAISLVSGERVDVPAGALAGTTVVELATQPASQVTGLPAEIQILGILSVGFPGAPALAQPVVLSMPRPPVVASTDLVLVLRLEEIQATTRLVMVGLARVTADRLLSGAGIPGVAPAPDAVQRSGRYAFARVTAPIGFAVGTVIGPTGQPFGGAIVASDGLPIVGRSQVDRPYAIPSRVGALVVSAIDFARADTGEARGAIANAGDVARLDVQLIGATPGVTSVTPASGADNVPLGAPIVVTFATPLDPASLAAAGVTPVTLTAVASTDAIAGALTLDNGQRRLTFRPLLPLAQDTAHRVVVSGALRDIAGRALTTPFTFEFRSLDTTPPPPPAAGALSVGVPDVDGFVTVTASQGTATPRDQVRVFNRTQDTFAPALVAPNGGFSVRVPAAPGDLLVLIITDQSGNQTTLQLAGDLRQVNGDGSISAVVGPEGGRVEGPAGIAVDVPAGAFPTATVITVKPIAEADYPMQLTAAQRQFFAYSGGFELDFRGAVPTTYLNVSIPKGPNDTVEDRWVVGQMSTFGDEAAFIVADTARVIDGRIMTASPPCPGVAAAEKYAFVKAAGRPLGLAWAPGTYNGPSTVTGGHINRVNMTGFSMAGINAAVNLPYSASTVGGGGWTKNLVCLPVLTGRVTVTPNRQRIRILSSQFGGSDRELVVRNRTTLVEYRYPRNLVQYKFVVPGTLTDVFTVQVVGTADRFVERFEVARASSTSVSIKLPMDAVRAGDQTIEITNVSQDPGVPTLFQPADAAASFPVAGSAGDSYDVTVIEADDDVRTVDFTVESPTGGGNLLAYALPVTIDPGTTVVLKNAANGDEVPIPDTAHDGKGGFSHGFDGNPDDAWIVEVRYPDGKVDATPIPKIQISVANPVTQKVLRTLTLPAPPPDEPLSLDPLEAPTELPTLTGTPPLLTSFDPAGVLSFTFSGPIDRASALAGVTLTNDAGKRVEGEVRLSAGNTVVTFVPTIRLGMERLYTLKMAGLTDVQGRPLAASTFTVQTFAPTRAATGIGNDQVGLAQDVEFYRKTGTDGRVLTIAAMVTPFGYDSRRLVLVDVTNPRQPVTLGSVAGPLGRRIAVVPDVSFTLREASPCTGETRLVGDLLVSSYTSTSQLGVGTSVQLYDITDRIAPCKVGSKLLASNLRPLDGALFAPGAGVGVAGLETTEGVTAYVGAADLGLLAVDAGANIPPREPVGSGTKPSILPGDYREIGVIDGNLGAIDGAAQTFDLVDPSLAKLASVDLGEIGLRPYVFAYANGFPIDRDDNGIIEPAEQKNLVFVGGLAGNEGQVAIIDLTNPGEPEILGVIPIPALEGVTDIAADPARRRVYAGASDDNGGWRVFMIDLGGPFPLLARDDDEDDLDDRIVWQSPAGSYWGGGNAFAFDGDRGLLYVPSQQGGLDAWSMTSACCDLGIDMTAEKRTLPSGDTETVLAREKKALQAGIKKGLQLAAACGVPIKQAPGADNHHVTIIEQGSGACFWKDDIAVACDGVYQPGVSDHDFEVFIPEQFFGSPAAECVTRTLGDQFRNEDGTPKAIVVDGVSVTFSDITFFGVRKEKFEAAKLDVLPAAAAGSDQSGDFGLGRQQLLLKWLLEGEYIDVPGFDLDGEPLEAILTKLRTTTRIPALEGHEWAQLQQYTLAKSRVLLRVVGASDRQSSLHDFFVAQLHDAGKAGIRAALARMVTEPAVLDLILDVSRNDYLAACLAIAANTTPDDWFDKPCTSFEEFVASMAGRAARLPAPVFTPQQVANTIHRFYRVKSNTERVTTDAAAHAFVAEAARFVETVKQATQGAYDRDIGQDADRQQRQDNLAAVGGARTRAIANASLHVVPRAFNFGFHGADQVDVSMHRGTAGPGEIVKSIRIDLSPAEQRFLNRGESILPDDSTGITPLDRNLADVSWIDPSRRTPVFVLGDNQSPANPPIRLDQQLNLARYVAFTIDLPEKKMREGNRLNNVGGFWYFVLDPHSVGGAPNPPAMVPLPLPDPDEDLLDPDAECEETGQLEVSQGIVFPDAPGIEILDQVTLDPGQSGTVRVFVRNTSPHDVADVSVCTSLGGHTCTVAGAVPASGTKVVDLPFTAPSTPQVFETIATASSIDVGVRASLPIRVTVGCETVVVAPLFPDPNPTSAPATDVMQGGLAIRYGRVVNRSTGAPVPNATVQLLVTDSLGQQRTISYQTNAQGLLVTGAELGMAIPVQGFLPAGTTITAVVDKVQGQSTACSNVAQFNVTVTDRTVKREWKAGSSIAAEGTIEIGLQGKKGSGLTLALTENKWKGRMQFDLGRTFSSEAGVLEKVGETGARLFLGAATIDASVSAKAGAVVQNSYGDTHTFTFAPGAQSLSADDAAAFAGVLAAGLATTGDPLTTKVLTRIASLVDPGPKLSAETTTLGLEGSVQVKGGITAALGVTNRETGQPLGSLGFGAEAVTGGAAKMGYTWSYTTNPQKHEIGTAYEMRGSVELSDSIGIGRGQDFNDPKKNQNQVAILDKLRAGLKGTLAGSAKATVTLDAQNDTKFKKLAFALSGSKGFGWTVGGQAGTAPKELVSVDGGAGLGVKTTITFTITDESAYAAVRKSLETIKKLGDFNDPAAADLVVLLGPGALHREVDKLVAILVSADVEYEMTEERGDAFTLPFGGALSIVGVSVELKKTYSLDRAMTYTTEKGILKNGELFALAKYTKDEHVPDVSETGRVDDLVALSEAAFSSLAGKLGDVVDIVTSPIGAGINIIRSRRTAELRLVGDNQPGLHNGLFLVSFTYDALPPEDEVLFQRPDDVAWPLDAPHYGVGGFHQFGPPGLQLVTPAPLTFEYKDDEVINIDESRLAIYRWDDTAGDWVYLGGVANPAANTVTVNIDRLGLYTVAAPMPAREITYTATSVPSGDALDPRTIVTYTSGPLVQNDGQPVPDGTVYTVAGARPGTSLFLFGNILTPDVDPETDGVQIRSFGGALQWAVDYPGADGIAIPLTFSRQGTAMSNQSLPLRPLPQ